MTKHLLLKSHFNQVRATTESICKPLSIEDYSTQVEWFASPPKWHLAHTTWFLESFILNKHYKGYKIFEEKYSYLFNSYYISKGDRLTQSNRGELSRPATERIYEYRQYVENHINQLLDDPSDEVNFLLTLGINHEQQHQELLLQDIKYNLGCNPMFPNYLEKKIEYDDYVRPIKFLSIDEGVYEVGHKGDDFFFDNEKSAHKQYIHKCQIADRMVTNKVFAGFIEDGGYENGMLWLSDGWKWKCENNVSHPLYWKKIDEIWHYHTLIGLRKLDPAAPVSHISFYEANAFARWAGYRLPTEFEWEVACNKYQTNEKAPNLLEAHNYLAIPSRNNANQFIGDLWEWTESAYQPYPRYKQDSGALGEYNGKFMVNQKVLRGGSFATPQSHIRSTYRNFYYPNMRWMFSGIRVARDAD